MFPLPHDKARFMSQKLLQTHHCVRLIQHSAFCTLHSAFCILHSAFCILHSAFCILHSAFIILHSAFCTLHSSFCTLHSASPDPLAEFRLGTRAIPAQPRKRQKHCTPSCLAPDRFPQILSRSQPQLSHHSPAGNTPQHPLPANTRPSWRTDY